MIEVVDALPPADRRSAFANAPMGVALTTPAGVLVDANPALCAHARAHGRGAARPLGARPGPPRRGARRPRGARLADRRTAAGRCGYETRLVRADGTDVPVQVTASWVDGDRRTARPPTW